MLMTTCTPSTAGASVAADRYDIAAYFDRLWPLLRSITGDGVRATHDILAEIVDLTRIEIPSGTTVFDWTVPKEWRVREAYVVTPFSKRILDVETNNLHLLNYSVPFRGSVSRAELDDHLYSDPTNPAAIPYRTSYYSERWGFCIAQVERDALPDGEYQVVVDTELFDGSMTISEAVLPGREGSEVLISTYTCHPSMANNELSGPLVAAGLYRRLAQMADRRLTYRFVFLPETIGSIAYLTMRGDVLRDRLLAGYVLTCIGDRGPFHYKRSRRSDTAADRAAVHVLQHDPVNRGSGIIDFFPSGSDECQYCSPGFDLPVGSLMRTMYGQYEGYHSSLDNREAISFEAMDASIELCLRVCQTLEWNQTFISTQPFGEPQLGRRGLYPTVGGPVEEGIHAMLWVLNLSDGRHDLLAIADRSGLPISELYAAATRCATAGLLELQPGTDGA